MHYQEFLAQASGMCREKWTQFDLPGMFMGVTIIWASCAALVAAVCLGEGNARLWLVQAGLGAGTGMVLGLVVSVLVLAGVVPENVGIWRAIACCSCVCSSFSVIRVAGACLFLPASGSDRRPSRPTAPAHATGAITSSLSKANVGWWFALKRWKDAVRLSSCQTACVICLLVYAQGLFSNSFIVAEHEVASFLASSSLLFILFSSGGSDPPPAASTAGAPPSTSSTRHGAIASFTTAPAMRRSGLVLAAAVCARMLGSGEDMRPDSTLAEPAAVLAEGPHGASGLVLQGAAWYQAVFSLACLPSVLFVVVERRAGALQSPDQCLPLHAGAVRRLWWWRAAWGLAWAQTACIALYWSQAGHGWVDPNVFPRLVYASSLLGLCAVAVVSRSMAGTARSTALPPLACAEAWVLMSATHLSVWCGPLLLLLGPRSPAVLLLVLCLVWCLGHMPSSQHPYSSWTLGFAELVFLFFLSVCLFFATGHKNDFSSLPASCAFVGFDEFQYGIGFVMINLHAFSGFILIFASLPLLIALRASSNLRKPVSSSIRTDDRKPHDGNLAAKPFCPSLSSALLYRPMVTLLLMFSVRLGLTMVNAVLQRRHLMVWAIFAPKYVFDGVTIIGLSVLSVVATLLGTIG